MSSASSFFLLLDVENWCVLPYYFNALSYLWKHCFVVQTVLPFTSRCYSSRYFPIAANEPEVLPIGLPPRWRKRWLICLEWAQMDAFDAYAVPTIDCKKNGRHVSTSFHYRKVKPKYPRYGRCHLPSMTSSTSWVGMARYHNFGFGTIPECNTSVSILNRYHRWQITSLKR